MTLRETIANAIRDVQVVRNPSPRGTVAIDWSEASINEATQRILAAVADALTSDAAVREGGRAIPTHPNFGANTWADDARACITAALAAAGIAPDAP